MAQIWADSNTTYNHNYVDNTTKDTLFRWLFVTFSGEEQAMAQVRWRKANTYSSIKERMQVTDATWSAIYDVGRFEDMTTWTLSGGQLTPPVAGSRRYSNITHFGFPMGTFSDGVWIIQIRFKTVGNEAGAWSDWVSHRIEFGGYELRTTVYQTSTGVVPVSAFATEGTYGLRVTTMSSAGILSAESAEITFNVWETNRYLNVGGVNTAVPEFQNGPNGTLRVKRNV